MFAPPTPLPRARTVRHSSAAPAAAATAKAVAPQGVQQRGTGYSREKRYSSTNDRWGSLAQYGPWKDHYHESLDSTAGSDQRGHTFSQAVPEWVRNVANSRYNLNYDGEEVTYHRRKELGRAMNRALRHDDNLPVNLLGFAWVTNLQFVLRHYPYRMGDPSVADLMFVVAKEREGRFEVAAHSSDFDERDVIIRCVQGHSGNVVAQMKDIYAHRRIWEPDNFPILLHATKTDLLKHIIGIGRPGLIPGGKGKKMMYG